MHHKLYNATLNIPISSFLLSGSERVDGEQLGSGGCGCGRLHDVAVERPGVRGDIRAEERAVEEATGTVFCTSIGK